MDAHFGLADSKSEMEPLIVIAKIVLYVADERATRLAPLLCGY
jgi:hypothetical protein